MGYSLSIEVGDRKKEVGEWLEKNFRPWNTGIKGEEHDYSALRDEPSYAPENKKVIGFDYGPVMDMERLYIWEMASVVARCVGQSQIYYDGEAIELSNIDWTQPVEKIAEEHCRVARSMRDAGDTELWEEIIRDLPKMRDELQRITTLWEEEMGGLPAPAGVTQRKAAAKAKSP